MTPMLGPAAIEYPHGQAWLRSRGAAPWLVEAAPIYWWFAAQTGIRPELGLAQCCKETRNGHFARRPDGTIDPMSVLDETWHNPAGIKTARGGGNYEKDSHQQFDSWAEGIRGHLNHLAVYCGAPFVGAPHERAAMLRRTQAWAGTRTAIEDLDDNWATSSTYGTDLVKRFLTPLLNSVPPATRLASIRARVAQGPAAYLHDEQIAYRDVTFLLGRLT